MTWNYEQRRSARTRERRTVGAQSAARDQRLLHRNRRASRRLSPISKTTAQPRRAAGSTPASAPTNRPIARAVATAAVRTPHRTGVGRGPRTGARSTTAPRPIPTASRGASARSTCGGMRTPRNGPASTFPISPRPKRRTRRAIPMQAGMDFHSGADPFIMMLEGKAQIFVPGGALKDAPIPAHYEPQQSVVHNELYKQQSSPVFGRYRSRRQSVQQTDRRTLSLHSHELSRHRDVGNHDALRAMARRTAAAQRSARSIPNSRSRRASKAAIGSRSSTALGEIEVRALVSGRMRPLRLGKGKRVHQIGVPYNYGNMVALARGDSVGTADSDLARSQRLDPRVQIAHVQHSARVAGRSIIATRSTSRYRRTSGIAFGQPEGKWMGQDEETR